jgi:uncharacterized protein with HEPN domain
MYMRPEKVWDAAKEDVPVLEKQIKELLEHL